MADLNRMTIIGRLGADPEVKSFQNGGRLANLRIATSENWKDKQTGEKKERTEWHSVTVKSDGLVGVVERYLKKGSRVYIEGQLQTRKWQDSNGTDRYTTEIVLSGFGGKLIMLDSGNSGGGQSSGGGSSGGQSGRYGQDSGGGGSTSGGRGKTTSESWSDELDDDIPF
jgi:single-strand DNA-binding protein